MIGFIKSEYGIGVESAEPAKRGFYGETWRLEAVGSAYFLKIVYPPEHKYVYERSFHILRRICDSGVEFVSRIVKTTRGALSARFDGAVLGVFEWIDGVNMETEETKPFEYQMLAKVYTVKPDGLNIPRENFSGNNSYAFYTRWNALEDEALLSLFDKHRAKIEYRAARLKHFAGVCRRDATNFFITHGDAGGNFFTGGGRNYLVDWDNPMLSPPERDAWFCMSFDWAAPAFHEALRSNGINYALRRERLAYYCYDFFFYYLNAYVDALERADVVEDYIEGWIKNSFALADTW